VNLPKKSIGRTDFMGLASRDFDYELDPQLVAQQPLEDRKSSRLMVLDRSNGCVEHKVFSDLPNLLRADDLLVVNDTSVIPARFFCTRETGGKVEGLFCRELQPGLWEVMLKNAGKCKIGEKLSLKGNENIQLELRENLGQGLWQLSLSQPGPAVEILDRVGITPLPPYIHRSALQQKDKQADRQRYQTVYAQKAGAVAAPTAGLHFTDELLDKLAAVGIETAKVTLHVGLGTFSPVKVEKLTEHKMHSEWFELSAKTAQKLNDARSQHRRIISVGTTSVRVLETAAGQGDKFEPTSGWTDIFIYPPAEFRAVDGLITNFHLPKSTLLMLVAAFCSPGNTDGVKMILDAYRQAVEQRYRFYSYGDAMLIL